MPKVPPHYQLLFSEEEITSSVARLGEEVSRWAEEVWQRSQTELLTLPILQGGIFLFADLVRHISRSVEIAPARTWGYESDVHKQRSVVEIDLRHVSARGRSILIVDDICDSGRTLEVLHNALRTAGAVEMRAAVLVTRQIDTPAYQPHYSAFTFQGSEWLVGYGMDDREHGRNLRNVYMIKQGESA